MEASRMKVSFEGSDQRFVQFLRSRLPTIKTALTERMQALMISLQAHIVADKLSGQVLHHRTGHLIDSVRLEPPQATVEGQMVVGGVQSGGAIATYAKIHEYGTTDSYEIVPSTKKALAFLVNGRQVVVKRVLHPPFPERSFMRSSLEDMRQTIVAGLQSAINESLSK